MKKRARSGIIQILLACGCFMLVAALAVVGGLFYYFFHKKAPAAPAGVTDSGQVKALTEQILPGGEAPPGHVGFLGQVVGNSQLAYQGPAGLAKDGTLQPTQLLISMISFPAGQSTQEQAEKQLRETLAAAGYQVGTVGKLVEAQEGSLTPKFGEVHFQRRTYEGTPRLLEYSMLLENPAGRTVELLVDGPLDAFNTPAMETFLDRLQARGLGSPSRPPVAVPTPEPVTVETPAPAEVATPVPATTPAHKKPHH